MLHENVLIKARVRELEEQLAAVFIYLFIVPLESSELEAM